MAAVLERSADVRGGTKDREGGKCPDTEVHGIVAAWPWIAATQPGLMWHVSRHLGHSARLRPTPWLCRLHFPCSIVALTALTLPLWLHWLQYRKAIIISLIKTFWRNVLNYTNCFAFSSTRKLSVTFGAETHAFLKQNRHLTAQIWYYHCANPFRTASKKSLSRINWYTFHCPAEIR